MIGKWKNRNDVAQHIFTGSTTMIGVCITIISLFKIMRTGKDTFGDEILGVSTLFFIFSCFLSYLCLRNAELKKIETIADILFFIGLILMLMVGFIVVFTTY